MLENSLQAERASLNPQSCRRVTCSSDASLFSDWAAQKAQMVSIQLIMYYTLLSPHINSGLLFIATAIIPISNNDEKP